MKDIFTLEDKSVVLTGGCGNLGRVMVKWLLEYGAELVIADILDELPEEISELSRANKLHYIKCDLSDTASVREMFEIAQQHTGSLDVLINNAAYGGGAGGKKCISSIDDVDDELWSLGLDGTVGVTFRCTREILPYFDKQGRGNIVNIASMYGMVAPDPSIYGNSGSNSPVTYGTGKAGVIQLTKYCASHLAERGIRVNCIVPGPFPNVTVNMDKTFYEKLKAKTMLGRTGDANELAGPILMLASDASSFMTGAQVVVDGGWTAW